MSIQSKYITSLELDKVLAKLANETTCEAARLRALRLTPVTTEEEAVRLMAYTADANRLTNRYGTPTAQNVRDCTGSLERARLGAQLPIPELLSILHLLRNHPPDVPSAGRSRVRKRSPRWTICSPA